MGWIGKAFQGFIALLFLAGGCGKTPQPPRRIALLDVGYPIRLQGSVLLDKAVERGESQYRVVRMPRGSELEIRKIPWPTRGTLEVALAPDDSEIPEGGALLEVSLRKRGSAPIMLGELVLAGAGGTGFRTEQLTWDDLEPGLFDLVFRVKGGGRSGDGWLCNGGVLVDPGPFEKIARKSGVEANLVLILIDTLRADHVGCYGYSRDTTPVLDRLAEEGLRFTDAWAQSSWTRPSTATILTSLPSYDHGSVSRFDLLADRVWTIAEELQKFGYRTGAFIANGVVGDAHWNFDQGFDHFIKVDGKDPVVFGTAEEVCQRGIEWLAMNGNKSCFLFLHLMDPHAPYTPPSDLEARFNRGYTSDVLPFPKGENGFRKRKLTRDDVERLIDLYDAEIAASDRAIGDFVDGLEALGLRDSTVLVVTSDHGEEFWDHDGLEHAQTLFEEQLNVPLLVTGPGIGPKGDTFNRLVRHMDIAPLVLGLLGLGQPDAFKGRNPLAKGARPLGLAIADLETQGCRVLAVRSRNLKLIKTYSPEASVKLFDLAKDPQETQNLANKRSEYVQKLANVAKTYEAQISRPGLYIACRGAEGIKKFNVQIAGQKPVDEHMLRRCESKDGFIPLKEINGVRFFLMMDSPDDVDIIYIVSALQGDYGLTVTADGEPIDPAKVLIGMSGTMKGPWPFIVKDQFASAVISPSPSIDVNRFVPPGGVAIFRILPGTEKEIPEAALEELRALGYIGGK